MFTHGQLARITPIAAAVLSAVVALGVSLGAPRTCAAAVLLSPDGLVESQERVAEMQPPTTGEQSDDRSEMRLNDNSIGDPASARRPVDGPGGQAAMPRRARTSPPAPTGWLTVAYSLAIPEGPPNFDPRPS